MEMQKKGFCLLRRLRMSWRLLCCLGGTIATTAAIPAQAHADGKPSTPVRVVVNARSDWRIVSTSEQTAGVPWAVAELRKYIRQMSGADLPASQQDEQGPAFVIGLRSDLPAADQAALPAPAKGYDGYAIAILAGPRPGEAGSGGRADRIIVGGDNGRGVVYAMYDLLEHFGCRWFYPTQNPNDPEVVPRRENLSIDAGAWTVASPMKHRICNGSSWFFEMNMTAAAQQLDWAMKNRYNGMGWQSADKTPLLAQVASMRKAGLFDELARRGMFLHGPAHSFHHFLKAEDDMDKHPEWFGMRDGKRVPQNFLGAQFCWSNAGARQQFIDNLEQFVKACPEIHILAIVPFDGGRACACPECTKIEPSNALMTLMREVIERLEKSAPGVLVETVGGYEPMTEPPTRVEPHPKQRVVWAHWGRYYGSGYDDPKYDRKANLESWQKAAQGGLTVCQYYTDNFAEPWVLPPFAIAIEGDRKYFLEKGVDSVYMLMWPPGYWWNHSLNGYLAGRCFYDVSLDPYALIQHYAVNYYGPVAGPLIGAYYEQWARQIDLAYHVRDDSLPKHWKMLADQRRNWIDPAVAAVKGDALLSARVARVEKLHALAERLCEVHRRRYEIQRLREKGEFEQAGRKLEEARIYAESVLYWFYALADLDQGLIERKEIGWFIKIKVRDWVEAEAKAIAEKNRTVDKTGVWKDLNETELLPVQ